MWGVVPMGDTHGSVLGVQEGILQQLEVQGVQGVQEDCQESPQCPPGAPGGPPGGPHMVQGNVQDIQRSSLEVQEVQREQDIGWEHSWYEIPRLALRFQVVQCNAGNFLLAFQDDEMQVVAFPKQ